MTETDLRSVKASYCISLGLALRLSRQGKIARYAKRLLGTEGRKGGDRMARGIKAVKDEWMSEWMTRLDLRGSADQSLPGDLGRDSHRRSEVHDRDPRRRQPPGPDRPPFWPALVPNSYIGWGKSTNLGYGLPLVMGAKVAKPEKLVINIMGDATLGKGGMDIETVARNRICTLTILLNNSCFGGYDKWLRVSTQLHSTRFVSGDYTKVAEGLGAHAERVEKPGEIIPAIQKAMKATADNRPAVVEFVTKKEASFSK